MNDKANSRDERTSDAESATAPEKLCDYLKRIRETKHVSLEKMARDTRLNLNYLYALEEGNFHLLPAEAYVRIYIRSVAKYLQMDPTDATRRYDEETAGPDVGEKKGRATKSLNTLSTKTRVRPVAITVAILILIAVFSFFRTGTRKSPAPLSTPQESDSPLEPKDPTLPAAGVEPSEPPTQDGLEKGSPPPDTSGKMLVLQVQCVRDSSWAMVYRDGENPWRQLLTAGQRKRFKARRNFHVALGRGQAVNILFNGKKANLPNLNPGVYRFTLDRTGARPVGLKDWLRRFPDYIPDQEQ